MPVKSCQLNDKPGYKWGDQGKCYTYNPNNEGSKNNAKKKAILQGVAIGEYESVQKNQFLNFIQENNLGISIEELGITEEQLNDSQYQHPIDDDEMKFEQLNFAVIRLYKYVSPDYGTSGIGPNTRSFCEQLVKRTNLSLMRYEDIDRLNSAQPGMGKGGSDSYSVFNWRGGNNCKHIWVKYLFDTTTNNLVKAPKADQPKNAEIGFSFEETYNDYPKAAVENAKIALRWAEENGWGSCGTPVGKARANQLANSENISRDTIARMAAFERHRQNSQKELGDGCGRLMWLAWGGDEGIEWAQRKLEQIDKK